MAWPLTRVSGAGQAGPGLAFGDCLITSLVKMYVCVSTLLGRKFVLNAAARSTVVRLMVIGPETTVPVLAVGAVPSVVYRIVAPPVAGVVGGREGAAKDPPATVKFVASTTPAPASA